MRNKKISMKYEEHIRSWQGQRDKETAHIEADALLCELLRELDYGPVVDEWEKVIKWHS